MKGVIRILIWPKQKEIKVEKPKGNSHGRCKCGHGGFVLSVEHHELIRKCPKCSLQYNLDTKKYVGMERG